MELFEQFMGGILGNTAFKWGFCNKFQSVFKSKEADTIVISVLLGLDVSYIFLLCRSR